MLDVFFLLIYSMGVSMFSGVDLYLLLTLHFSIHIFQIFYQKKIQITPIAIYYVGVVIVNISNISFASQVLAHEQIKIYNYIKPRYIDEAAQLWCISSTLIPIGYNMFKSKSMPSIFLKVSTPKTLRTIFYLLLVLNILQIYGYGIGRSQVGKIIGLLNAIGILFFARLWAKENNKTYRNYSLSLYVLLTYFALISSYLRFELILPTFYIFVGYFIGKGEIKYLFSYRVVPFLAVVIIYSSVFAELQRNRSNFISIFTKTTPAYTIIKKAEVEEKKSGGFWDRSSNVAQMTNVVDLVKRNGFYLGRASMPLFTAFIPRFLWPDKPKIQLGAWFALEIGAAYKNEFGVINNSVNMTVAGQLYLDFGWLGVIIGSILFGGYLAILWNATRFYDSEYNLTGTIFGGYLIMLSIGSYADLQIVITLTSTYLIFFAIKKYVKIQ